MSSAQNGKTQLNRVCVQARPEAPSAVSRHIFDKTNKSIGHGIDFRTRNMAGAVGWMLDVWGKQQGTSVARWRIKKKSKGLQGAKGLRG